MSGINTNGLAAVPVPLSGLERIPVDTQQANGSNPQSGFVTTAQLGAGPVQYAEPAAAATVNAAAGVTAMVLNPAGVLATLTVNMPPNPTQGQRFRLGSSQTITALTLATTDGTTIAQNPTALTVSTTVAYGYEFVFQALTAAGAALNKWIRLQ